jgi:uncharacterized protein (DUF302 family)
MAYTINRLFKSANLAEISARTRAALASEGFGVLTEIDVKATLKAKIGAETGDYLILGACNPKMAHQAMQIEPRVGAMLPCNVILRAAGPGDIEVSAIDPVASMAAIDNATLKQLAGQVRAMLENVVRKI